MVDIIKENRKPSFSDRLFQGAGKAASDAATEIPKFFGHKLLEKQKEAERQQISQLLGQDINNIHNPDLQKILLAEGLKGQAAGAAKGSGLETAKSALNTIKGLIDKPGIGLLGQANLSDKARYNRGVFESTNAALLPLFKSMFPRGMTEKEFKYVNEHFLPQPGDTEEKIRGKIKGLEQLLETQSGGAGSFPNMDSEEKPKRPPLSSFG